MLNFTSDDFLDDVNFGLPSSFKCQDDFDNLVEDMPTMDNQTDLIFKLADVEENQKFVTKLKENKMTR